MKIETKKVWVNGEFHSVDIKKLSLDEFREKIICLPVKTFLDEKDYVPKIVDMCWVRGAFTIHEGNNSLSYYDMVNLYQTVLEVNPDFDFKNWRVPPSTLIKKEDKHALRNPNPLEERCEEEYSPSLEETISIVDFKDLIQYYDNEVIGQEEAINDICKVLINVKHIGMPKDGVASYYLLDPSGVGKTSSIKILSGFLES